MRTSSRPSCPFGLRIGGSSTEGSNLRQIGGGFNHLDIVVERVHLASPSSPHGKGKGKVSKIRYPGGFAYLKAIVQNAEAVGPSQVKLSFGHNFASRYRPPFGVRIETMCPLENVLLKTINITFFSENVTYTRRSYNMSIDCIIIEVVSL